MLLAKVMKSLNVIPVSALLVAAGCQHEPVVTDPADLTVVLPPKTRIVQVEDDAYRPQVLQPRPDVVRDAEKGKIYQAGKTVEGEVVVDGGGFVRIEETGGVRTQAANKPVANAGVPIVREPAMIADELALELTRTRAEIDQSREATKALLERTEQLMQSTLEMRETAKALAERTASFEEAVRSAMEQQEASNGESGQ